MAEALDKARLRLAISSDMRDAYEAKYKRKFWVAPPTIRGHAKPMTRASNACCKFCAAVRYLKTSACCVANTLHRRAQ